MSVVVTTRYGIVPLDDYERETAERQLRHRHSRFRSRRARAYAACLQLIVIRERDLGLAIVRPEPQPPAGDEWCRCATPCAGCIEVTRFGDPGRRFVKAQTTRDQEPTTDLGNAVVAAGIVLDVPASSPFTTPDLEPVGTLRPRKPPKPLKRATPTYRA